MAPKSSVKAKSAWSFLLIVSLLLNLIFIALSVNLILNGYFESKPNCRPEISLSGSNLASLVNLTSFGEEYLPALKSAPIPVERDSSSDDRDCSNNSESKSRTVAGEIVSSSLMANWSDVIVRESGNLISFTKIVVRLEPLKNNRDRNRNMNTARRGKQWTSFWYSVEDTLGAAQYIIKHELAIARFFLQKSLEMVNVGLPCNVLDVGSNGGFFSLLARSVGCNVMAVDAQPWCLHRLSSSAAVNGFHDGFHTTWAAVSEDPNLSITVGATKCSGLWAVRGSEWINRESTRSVAVKSRRCIDIVDGWLGKNENSSNLDNHNKNSSVSSESITVMKIDAEGSEISVIRSALPLIREGRIAHIWAEFVPARTQSITPFPQVVEAFRVMYSSGYRCYRGSWKPSTEREMNEWFNPKSSEKGRGQPQMTLCSLSSSP